MDIVTFGSTEVPEFMNRIGMGRFVATCDYAKAHGITGLYPYETGCARPNGITSLAVDGMQYLQFDFDNGVPDEFLDSGYTIVQSTNNVHVYGNIKVPRISYMTLLDKYVHSGHVQWGFKNQMERYGFTNLRAPWTRKLDTDDNGYEGDAW
jgi:hypothetical protein